MDVKIVFENNDLIIIDKPFGLQVEPDKNNHPNLLHTIIDQQKLKDKLFVVNRIDRPTSGLVVFAKKKSACTFLQSEWTSNNVRKKYLAIVQGQLSNGSQLLQHFIYKDFKLHRAIVSDTKVNDDYKECKLQYNVLTYNNDWSLLEIELLTGRYHQIRAQLSYIGHPIWNDILYGAEKKMDDSCIGLHCYYNSFKISGTSAVKTFSALPMMHPAFGVLENWQEQVFHLSKK
ncbi:MAG: RNA pseudouridine synthase [Saprospiraceae bacterium]|nr:RNA pseudouridine synthase [Saprospiraceae bacterium]